MGLHCLPWSHLCPYIYCYCGMYLSTDLMPLATDHILMQPQALSKRDLGAALKCDQLPVFDATIICFW